MFSFTPSHGLGNWRGITQRSLYKFAECDVLATIQQADRTLDVAICADMRASITREIYLPLRPLVALSAVRQQLFRQIAGEVGDV